MNTIKTGAKSLFFPLVSVARQKTTCKIYCLLWQPLKCWIQIPTSS